MSVKYTGLNKLFRSDSLQKIINKRYDGTFTEFIDDWKWIFSFSKKYRLGIVIYTVLGILGSTLSLGAAYVSRLLINIITDHRSNQLWLLFGGMLGMAVFSLIVSSITSRISMKISINVNNDIQAEIFDRIIDARWKELSQYQSGDLLNRFNGDVGTIAGNAVNWIPNIIINVYTFIITFFALFRTDRIMALIAFISAPFMLGMSRYIMRKMKEYRKRVLELNSKMMSFEVETFYNFDTVKSFGIFDHYSKGLRGWQKKFKDYNLDYNKFEIKSKIMLTLVSIFVSLIAFSYCLFRLWNNAIGYGDMTFFLQQRAGLSNRFSELIGSIPGMLNSAVSAHRIRELIDLPREKHDPLTYDRMKQIADAGIAVKLNDVTFSYGADDKAVYSGAKFEAKPGEIIAILSPSGGGKTTLMRLLLGMIEPEKGSVTLTGCDGADIPVNADLRKLFAYVPQGNTMLSGTVAENMRIVREDVTDDEIIAALKTACAYDFVAGNKDGINGKLGERGRGISEGQAQRISIARALIRNSPVLLLDEATSALDIDTEETVLSNIVKQHPNKVIIISTHRPSALKLCKRIYRIADGAIVETNAAEAEKLMWRYSDMPDDSVKRTAPGGIKTPDMPLSPKSVETIIPDETGSGWWNN